ncbi:hypothetical protein [Conexibacter sp. CPCC 206217]|uniref:hypothetical protein n=1 Tax=Conexibacter sp. CPCC 206217 TaxID=3064574 RepID=UPI00271EC754|nr:hypothetical protein [Conexibacter sp. CPCC 206217]MDO8213451.1 hypothetical protein [Conexibacter sp. CPCC 206217]
MALSPPASTPASAPAQPAPDWVERAARLHHEMSQAPVGSKQRRFLKRAAERALKRAAAEQRAA